MSRVSDMVRKGLGAGPVVLTLSRKKRSANQNALFHVLITDIAKTVDIGMRYGLEEWKALLVDQFEQEMINQQNPLKHRSRVVISFDGSRAVTVRPSTTKFNKAEGGQFIEFLYCWGSEHGAAFSEESNKIYEDSKK